MAFRKNPLAALIQVDPARAAQQIEDQFVRAGCRNGELAKALAISWGTLLNYVDLIDSSLRQSKLRTLTERMAEARSRVGKRPSNGPLGRPVGSKDSSPRTRRVKARAKKGRAR